MAYIDAIKKCYYNGGTMINPQIFREYDIRGIVDKDLTDKAVENIGLSFGTYLHSLNLKSVALGGDCRLSTNRFQAILSDAMAQTGCKVIDVGTVPTPVLYYAIEKLQTDGGLMVTGSHNPPDFNGFKLCVGTFSIYGQEIQKIREIIDDGVYISGEGSCEKYDSIIQDYQDYVVEHLFVDRPIKVIVDSGNGTAGPVAPDIYRRLGCEVISIFEEMDGTFPNHHPDPTVKENIEILIRKVIDEKADVGIGFDGDSDRIGHGSGTGGSRSTTVTGGAIVESAEIIIAKARRIAAQMLETNLQDQIFLQQLNSNHH